jgi:hypothetical protein
MLALQARIAPHYRCYAALSAQRRAADACASPLTLSLLPMQYDGFFQLTPMFFLKKC